MKYVLFGLAALAIVLAGCSAQPQSSLPKEPFHFTQDLESCIKFPDQPWCKRACDINNYDWCK